MNSPVQLQQRQRDVVFPRGRLDRLRPPAPSSRSVGTAAVEVEVQLQVGELLVVVHVCAVVQLRPLPACIVSVLLLVLFLGNNHAGSILESVGRSLCIGPLCGHACRMLDKKVRCMAFDCSELWPTGSANSPRAHRVPGVCSCRLPDTVCAADTPVQVAAVEEWRRWRRLAGRPAPVRSQSFGVACCPPMVAFVRQPASKCRAPRLEVRARAASAHPAASCHTPPRRRTP